MGLRENKVESYLDQEVRYIGGITRKWQSSCHNGVPDRIVIYYGDIWFVEVKTPDGRLSPSQKREHQRLKENGANVTTVYSKEGVDEFIRILE